jgi:hypothetical protein
MWRHARTLAAEKIDGLRAQVRDTLEDATGVLDSEGVRSDAWFVLAERPEARNASICGRRRRVVHGVLAARIGDVLPVGVDRARRRQPGP